MAKVSGPIYPSFSGYGQFSGGVNQSTDVFLRLVDSRIETGQERMMRSLSDVKADLLALINAKASRTDVFGTGVAVVVTLVAIATWGGDRFDGGIQLQGSVSESVVRANEGIGSNSRKIEELVSLSESREEVLSEILRVLDVLDARTDPETRAQDEQN